MVARHTPVPLLEALLRWRERLAISSFLFYFISSHFFVNVILGPVISFLGDKSLPFGSSPLHNIMERLQFFYFSLFFVCWRLMEKTKITKKLIFVHDVYLHIIDIILKHFIMLKKTRKTLTSQNILILNLWDFSKNLNSKQKMGYTKI